MSTGTDPFFLSDQETAVDLLYYEAIARTVGVLGVLEAAAKALPPPVVGQTNKVRTKGAALEAVAPPEAEDWLRSDWAKGWAQIEPPLAEVDLRPYVFVTRDKRSYFAGVIASDHLEALVEKLSGSAMAARSAETEIARITDVEAEQVFDALQARILSSDKLAAAPPGVAGLARLVVLRPALQRRLLTLLTSLPTDKVGGWAVSSWTGAFVDVGIVAEFGTLRSSWAETAVNRGLKASAGAFGAADRAG